MITDWPVTSNQQKIVEFVHIKKGFSKITCNVYVK